MTWSFVLRASGFVLNVVFLAVAGWLTILGWRLFHDAFPGYRWLMADAVGVILRVTLVVVFAYYGIRCALAFRRGIREAGDSPDGKMLN
jgi:hypothetical protein